jgi:SAM-dependent methyltransferase
MNYVKGTVSAFSMPSAKHNGMIDRLKQVYSREMFIPSFLGIFINPLYFLRHGLYKGVVLNKKYLKGRLLDFGCGNKPYKELFDVQDYVGLDIEVSGHGHQKEQIDVYYDGKTIPFEDNHFDSVFSSEVFEHIFNLEQVLSEVHRVMKPGGHLLVTVPFVFDEHEIPYDFARYTSFGIDYLLTKAGFEVFAMLKTTNYVETVFQMWNAYVYQFVLPSNTFLRMLMTPLFIAPVTIVGLLISKVLPENRNFYQNNVVVARKPTSKQLAPSGLKVDAKR